jgi:hypothetical protein
MNAFKLMKKYKIGHHEPPKINLKETYKDKCKPDGLNCEREMILSRPGLCKFSKGSPVSKVAILK